MVGEVVSGATDVMMPEVTFGAIVLAAGVDEVTADCPEVPLARVVCSGEYADPTALSDVPAMRSCGDAARMIAAVMVSVSRIADTHLYEFVLILIFFPYLGGHGQQGGQPGGGPESAPPPLLDEPAAPPE